MATIAISLPTVVVNNVTVAILPNTFKYTSGFGAQKMRTQSSGGGSVDVVYSDDATSKMSKVTFDVINTSANEALARSWKVNGNQNAISVSDSSGFSRSFANMALVGDFEVDLGADGKISLEFMGNGSV